MQEKSYKNIIKLVMGTREDHVPQPIRVPFYIWLCARCNAKTYTESMYPSDMTIICNVCAGELAAQAEQGSSTDVIIQPSDELNHSMERISDEKGVPVWGVFDRFLEWKLRRPIQSSLKSKLNRLKEEK